MGDLVGASLDGCPPCQEAGLNLLEADPVTTARLVHTACLSVASLMGGIPSSLHNPDVSGIASTAFRNIARAGVDIEDEHALMQGMLTVSEALTHEQRRTAANSALELLAGSLGQG
jgi:hypothetical protein